MFEFIINLFKRRIFLIGDLHLDHKNIIKYCHRPFKSVDRMNYVLLKNWNKTIRKKDIVYHLGDFTFKASKIGYWLKKFNGTIIFISGSHDRALRKKYFKRVLKYRNRNFLLIHDPKDVPEDWHDWVIHGHKHNNHIKNFPLVNGRKKTVNVSCELVSYTPLNIDDLFKYGFYDMYKWETVNQKPVYKKL